VSWRLRGLESLDEATDVLVLDLAFVVPTEADWEATRKWVEAGGVLLVAGNAAAGFPELGTRVASEGDAMGWATTLVGPFDAALPAPKFPRGALYGWEEGTGRPWIQGDHPPVLVSVDIGEGVVLGLADSQLLWNGALVDPDNERFLGDLFYFGQSVLGWPLTASIRLQLATTAGSSDPSPARALANANLLPFVLQLLFFWVLVALWKGYPFGPLRDPPEEGRLRFSDHVSALGRRYERAGASRYAASAYAQLWLARMGSAGLQLAAQRSGQDVQASRRFVASIEALASEPDGANQPMDLDLVEELWRVTRT